MSVLVVSIKDPYKPEENSKEKLPYIPNANLNYYLSNFDFNSANFVVALQGKIINCEDFSTTIVADNAIISVCAVLGASVIAGAVSGALFSTAFSTAVAYSLTYAAVYLAASFAISYGLSTLASVLGPDVSTPGSVESDPTYGWGELTQSFVEGTGCPYIFGTNKVSGQVLNYFTRVEDNDEILCILLGFCDHEASSIDNIKLNNRDIDSFNDVRYDTRLGTLTDTPIEGFDDLITTNAVGSGTETGVGLEIPLTGNLTDKITIQLIAPSGMYKFSSSGNLHIRIAHFQIETKLHSDSDIPANWGILTFDPDAYDPAPEGDWDEGSRFYAATRLAGVSSHDDGIWSWTGRSTAAIRKSIHLKLSSQARWDIKITRLDEIITNSKQNDTVVVSSIQEVISDAGLQYPGLTKMGISIRATEQLSNGIPNISCQVSKDTVSIWDEDAGPAAWVEKRATNPAWICWYLLNHFGEIEKSRLIWEDFVDWADYCDELVDSEYRFIASLVINQGNFWDRIQEIARLGRAVILRRGTRYGVFCDKKDSITSHLFSMGNIIDDSYSIHYLNQTDAANAIEIDFTDKDKDFTRQVVTVFSDEYLSSPAEPKKANISVKAAISEAQAVRDGIYRINGNTYLKRVVTFDAFIDSFSCIVGDIFYFQHSMSDIDRFGGRIVGASNGGGSTPTITFDRELTITTGDTFKVAVRLADDTIVEKTLSAANKTSDTFDLTSVWVDIPDVSQYPPYIFGSEDNYKKKYRLTSVTRKDDLTRTLIGMEYIEDVYDNNDAFVITGISESAEITSASNVLTSETLVWEENIFKSAVNVSWTPPDKRFIYKEVGADSTLQSAWDVYLENLTLTTDFTSGGSGTLAVGDYIKGDDSGSIGLVSELTLVSGTWSGTAAGSISFHLLDTRFLSETVSAYSDAECTTLIQTNIATLSSPTYPLTIKIGRATSNTFLINPQFINKDNTFMVYVNSPIEGPIDHGDNTDTILITGQTEYPADVEDLALTWQPLQRSILATWTENTTDPDLLGYEIRKGASWGTSEFVVQTGKVTVANIPIVADFTGSVTVLIKAVDLSSPANYSENADSSSVSIDTTNSPTVGASFDDVGDPGSGTITGGDSGDDNRIGNDGVIAKVTADRIQTGKISSNDTDTYFDLDNDKIVFNGKDTFSTTSTGIFIGLDDGDYKLNIGDANSYIKWDNGLSIKMTSGETFVVGTGGEINVQGSQGVICDAGADIVLTGDGSDPGSIIFNSDDQAVEFGMEGTNDILSILPDAKGKVVLNIGNTQSWGSISDPNFKSIDMVVGPDGATYTDSHLRLTYNDTVTNLMQNFLYLDEDSISLQSSYASATFPYSNKVSVDQSGCYFTFTDSLANTVTEIASFERTGLFAYEINLNTDTEISGVTTITQSNATLSFVDGLVLRNEANGMFGPSILFEQESTSWSDSKVRVGGGLDEFIIQSTQDDWTNTAVLGHFQDVLTILPGSIAFKEMAAPSTKVDYGQIFAKTDRQLFFKDSDGWEKQLTISTEDGITSLGDSQATATQLTATVNIVSVVTSTDYAVKLPSAVEGKKVYIKNTDGYNNLRVYPYTGDFIDDSAVNVYKTLTDGSSIIYIAMDDDTWQTF